MRQLLLLTAAVFLFMSWDACFAAKPTGDAVLESISYEKDDNNVEKIIFKLNGAHIPKVFQIKGERPRVVFDFIDTRYSDLINRIIDTKGNLVAGVRVGIHNDPPKTRVVIDLKPEGDFQIEQDFQVPENTLSITFNPNQTEAEKASEEPDKSPAAALPPPASGQPQAGPVTVTPDPVVRAVETVPAKPEEVEKKPASAAQPSAPEKDTSAALPPAGGVPAEPERGAEPAASAETAAAVPEPADKAAAPGAAPAVAADPVLLDVSFETTADNSEMVLFKLNDFYPPIVFGIEKGNPRVVCDFLDTALDKGVRSSIETKGNYISGIRVARHSSPNKVRVVLDLVPNRNYDLQQVFFKEDNLFIIIINEFEEEPVPAAELNREALPKS